MEIEYCKDFYVSVKNLLEILIPRNYSPKSGILTSTYLDTIETFQHRENRITRLIYQLSAKILMGFYFL